MPWESESLNHECFDHEASDLCVIETHISYVILAGPFAYKIKKAIDLGFLDYTTLDRRRFFCEEELRLNRRLAPDLYLEVVPISGSATEPHFGGDGEPFEYAVKMRRFDDRGLVSAALVRGEVRPDQIDGLALSIARFHDEAAVASRDSPYGIPQNVRRPMDQCFEQIQSAAMELDVHESAGIEELRLWAEREFVAVSALMLQRRADGRVRECHGDMHAGNMTIEGGDILVFDGIEFEPFLRWIDVMSEVAFATMDFEDRGRVDLARRFLNGYLEIGGDYSGLRLLNYYSVYRALVRAKVTGIRLHQDGLTSSECRSLRGEILGYIHLAESFTEARPVSLAITHGFSGSGKSTRAGAWVEHAGAVRLRSDVERKRLFAEDSENLYSSECTAQTYERLIELSSVVLESGRSVVVDATFLRRRDRDRFRDLALSLGAKFAILDCRADPDLLRERVAQRQGDVSDATVSVLERQMAEHDPLGTDEEALVVAPLEAHLQESSAE